MAKDSNIHARISASDRARFAAAAEAQEMTLAAWVRDQLLRAVGGASQPRAALQPLPRQGVARKVGYVTARFTEAQVEAIDEHARACGLTRSAFVCELVLGFRPLARRPRARSAIVAVHRASNNLEQLIRLANRGVVLAPDLMRTVIEVMQEVHALRDALLEADQDRAAEAPR